MDLIDLLHINNDTMSFTLAFASLAYSFGGLLGGFLFNYMTRPIMVSIFYIFFGLCNYVTPFVTSSIVFTVITCFKMICAGGADCGNNVWTLDIWPGKDQWLQALHFTFAVGTAIGPLIAEPFLSEDHKGSSLELDGALAALAGKTSGSSTINDQNNETKIHIPFAISATLSLISGFTILYLHFLSERRHKADALLEQTQNIKLKTISSSISNNNLNNNTTITSSSQQLQITGNQYEQTHDNNDHQYEQVPGVAAAITSSSSEHEREHQEREPLPSSSSSPSCPPSSHAHAPAAQEPVPESAPAPEPAPEPEPEPEVTTSEERSEQAGKATETEPPERDIEQPEPATKEKEEPKEQKEEQVDPDPDPNQQFQLVPITPPSLAALPLATDPQTKIKITSKMRDDPDKGGRTPRYVKLAVMLAATSLSFYCGIEITSMNYLATFAVNIDLQLSKTTAALMSSALTISFAIGRGLGIYLACHMKPHKLFYLCCFVMITGNVVMLIVANSAEILLWASICLFGLGCAPIYPAIVSFYDYKICKVSNTVSGIFVSGSMFNVALSSLIIGHQIIDNALILLICNLLGSFLLLLLFGTLHMLTKVKTRQRVRKYKNNKEHQPFKIEHIA